MEKHSDPMKPASNSQRRWAPFLALIIVFGAVGWFLVQGPTPSAVAANGQTDAENSAGVADARYDNMGAAELIAMAESGDAQAQFKLGSKHYDGEGVVQDYSSALKWYQLAADQGNANAQTRLGFMYGNGIGVAKNEAVALNLYRKSADQGNSRGQYNLGTSYAYGFGVKKDAAAAVYWYRKSADQGYSKGQINLGVHYVHGDGIPQDYKVAAELFRRAAEQGDANGQLYFGMANLQGMGVTQDYVQAYKWFSLSAARANNEALRIRATEDREKAAAKLSPIQIAKAQMLAGVWREK